MKSVSYEEVSGSMELMTVKELSIRLEISVKAVYTRIYTHKIKSDKKKGRINYFRVDKFVKPEIIRYYPIKTHEVYYIYESKMNYNVQ